MLNLRKRMADDYNPDVVNALNAQKRAQNLLSYGYAPIVDPVDETFVPMVIIPKKVEPTPYEAETMPYDMQDTNLEQQRLMPSSPKAKFEFISTAYGADKFPGSTVPSDGFNMQTIVQKGKQTYKDIKEDYNFVSDIWGPYYQTDDSLLKNSLAIGRLSTNWKVPEDALPAIDTAASIFEGDSGYTKLDIQDMLGKVGQIESQYESKVQKNNGPARSYWQVEPTTALDLLKNSKAIFGTKFENTFHQYAQENKSAREVLSSRTEKQIRDLLLKDDRLAATLAAGKIIATTKKK